MATKKTSLPKARQLLKQSLLRLMRHWPVYVRVTAVYGILDLLLVRGLNRSVNLTTIKGSVTALGANRISALFGAPTTAGGGDAGNLYQSILLIIASLAIIWCLRQLSPRRPLAGKPKKKPAKATAETADLAPGVVTKQAYYRSTYALVPFVLLLLLMSIQFLPMLISGAVYSTVVSRGLANGVIENTAWFLAFFGLSIWSLYMMSASIVGLFIVTLPDMTPMAAWRAARNLMAGRRWLVLRKLLALPVALIVAVIVISLPFAVLLPPVAEWVFFALGIVALPVSLSYVYGLYLELL